MLSITIPAKEGFNQITQEFVDIHPAKTIQLEHSLVSISKWESKWCKPFLSKDPKTKEESIDYVRCMTVTQNVDPEVYERLTDDILRQITEYIDAPMTATTFSTPNTGRGRREIITAELIYYWMIAANIPFECQKWHLNKLLTLIQVCNIKNSKPQKMSRKTEVDQRKALNEARRKSMGSKG